MAVPPFSVIRPWKNPGLFREWLSSDEPLLSEGALLTGQVALETLTGNSPRQGIAPSLLTYIENIGSRKADRKSQLRRSQQEQLRRREREAYGVYDRIGQQVADGMFDLD